MQTMADFPIKDQPADRAAVALMIDFTHIGRTLDWSIAPVTVVNAAWLDLAGRLLALPRTEFHAYWTLLEARMASLPMAQSAVAARAGEMFGSILDARHAAWAAQGMIDPGADTSAP